MNEEWRVAPGFPDYEVSSLGRVRRVTEGGPNTWPGRILVCRRDTHGYRFSQTGKRETTKRFWVHLLVAEAFHGPRPEGMVADHINRDRGDNRAENLRWVTRSQNVRHGSEVAVSKFNSEAVKVIRYMLREHPRRGLVNLLARLHGATHEAVRKVGNGSVWRTC